MPEPTGDSSGRRDRGGSPDWPSTDADWPSVEPDAEPPRQEPNTLFLPSEQRAAGEQTEFITPLPPQNQPHDEPTVSTARPVDPPTVQHRAPVRRPGPPQQPQRAMPMRIEPAGAPQPTEPHQAPPPAQPQQPPAPPAATEVPAQQDDQEPRRRRRHPVLWSLLALLLVVGIGAAVLFTVPGVASRVGLAQFDPAQTREDPPQPIAVSPALRAVTGKAATPDGVSAALREVAADPALARLTGVVLDAATGRQLWSSNPDTPLAPGSTNKVLTAAASLLALDPQARLSTKVVAGAEPGSVVIVGGGDPSLTALPEGEEGIYPDPTRLDDLVAKVKRNLGGQVGKVSIDQRAFTGDSFASGWLRGDIGAGNITPIVPGMLDGGRTQPQEVNPPRTDNPAGDLVSTFADKVGGTAAGEGTAPKNAKVLGEVRSAPVEDLVATMLDTSDNVLGEMMTRQVAKATGNPTSFDGGAKGVLETLRKNGFDTAGVKLADGSGLSTDDRIPAKLLAEVLGAAAGSDTGDPRTAKLRPLLSGLPVAGGTGTLAEGRFDASDTTQSQGYVRAKTGTLSDVSSLAGVVLDEDNRLLVFAMMSNGASPLAARPALDAIATKLRECGC